MKTNVSNGYFHRLKAACIFANKIGRLAGWQHIEREDWFVPGSY